ncbi:MAG TPA: hypothetical protein VK688_05670, partial [Gemmatimonadales bacterium]|nr:hypothetical protein [Gemmatimonadales bacterium]
RTDDGELVTLQRCRSLLADELARLERSGVSGRWREAAGLLDQLVSAEEFPEFLTIGAYEKLE